MLRIEVDSQGKRLVFEGIPKGEAEMLRVEVVGYRLEREEGAPVLLFDDLIISREWLQQLVAVLLPEKKIALPETAPLELLKALM